MARYTDAVCKLCRRERQKLFLKGAKCYTEKCPIERRNYPPGQHGSGNARRAKVTEYGTQLREKQKIKRMYNLLESQFRLTFEKASRQRGVTGENLVKRLESRLDNIVYRLGFASSRSAARQLVLHRHLMVNGVLVNIPSYILKPGDVVTVRPKSRKLEVITESLKRVSERQIPAWLQLDKTMLKGTYLNTPERADIPMNANEQLVVELYSK
ncbi:MAG: 30S ribosomal protein S4 [Chlorobi bacterium]|nr:30S ribosomal protein S4 [Chlorobiota bacterium]MCE7934328.1 30S ribosomal protein S4 [Chlorobi bacterium CHB2]